MKKRITKSILGLLSFSSVVSCLTIVPIKNNNYLEYETTKSDSLTRSQYVTVDLYNNNDGSSSSSGNYNGADYSISIIFADGISYWLYANLTYSNKKLSLKIWNETIKLTTDQYNKYFDPNIVEVVQGVEDTINKEIAANNWNISINLKSINFKNLIPTSYPYDQIIKEVPIEYSVIDYEMKIGNETTLTIVSVFLGIFCFVTLILLIYIINASRKNKKHKHAISANANSIGNIYDKESTQETK